MNKVSQVKSSIRKERWLSIIKECQSSGMTIRKHSKTRRSDTVPILRYDIRSLFI